MAAFEPPIIDSPLSQTFSHDDVTVRVAIFKLEAEEGWTLEVINGKGTSTVWEDQFETDNAAFEAFRRVVEFEGMETFLDDEADGWTTIH